MKFAVNLILTLIALIATTDSVAASHDNRKTLAQRDVAACMTQRMGASRRLTYNDALALCQPPSITRVVERRAPNRMRGPRAVPRDQSRPQLVALFGP